MSVKVTVTHAFRWASEHGQLPRSQARERSILPISLLADHTRSQLPTVTWDKTALRWPPVRPVDLPAGHPWSGYAFLRRIGER